MVLNKLMSIRNEIFSQPDVLESILNNQWETVVSIASAIREHNIKYIFLAARGSSDNAGLYAKYLFGVYNRLPIALAAPSLFSIYQSPPFLEKSLVLGISQSGQSPDIVKVISEGRKQGVPTLAITNSPDSPIAKSAEYVLDIHAGTEKAVAATKTYTAQLLMIAMISIALKGDLARLEDLNRIPDLVKEVLQLDEIILSQVERYRYMQHCVILGRGFNYATAFEWSLKLKELAYIVSEPYSSADFQHGPVALVADGFPVLSVVPDGAVFEGMHEILTWLVSKRNAELIAISNRDEILSIAHSPLRLPKTLPEWISPIISIVPAQLFSYRLTQSKGFDTDHPRGLSKVTKTN